MLLYCVIKRVEEVEGEEPIKVCVDQREAYNYKKTVDPENIKDLMIYVVEV